MMNQAPNIQLKDTRDVVCECGNIIFMPGYRFRKVSRLLTGEAKDAVIPIELFLCTNCGKPLNELIPEELRIDTEENDGKKIIN